MSCALNSLDRLLLLLISTPTTTIQRDLLLGKHLLQEIMEPVGAVNECGGDLSKDRKRKMFSDCLHIGLHIVSSHTACSNLITDSMTQGI